MGYGIQVEVRLTLSAIVGGITDVTSNDTRLAGSANGSTQIVSWGTVPAGGRVHTRRATSHQGTTRQTLASPSIDDVVLVALQAY